MCKDIYKYIKDFPAFTSFIETSMSEVEDEGIFQVGYSLDFQLIHTFEDL